MNVLVTGGAGFIGSNYVLQSLAVDSSLGQLVNLDLIGYRRRTERLVRRGEEGTLQHQIGGDWRLNECQIYITKEPYPMCAGAMVHARLGRVIFGCPSPKDGAGGSLFNLLQHPSLNHRCEITSGVRHDECRERERGKKNGPGFKPAQPQ